MIFKPVWSQNIREAPTTDQIEGKLFWYRTEREFGFIDLAGNVAVRERILFDATLTDSGYINFPRIPENLVLRDDRGNFLRSFRLTGYPILDSQSERLFLLNSESTGLMVVNVESEESWTVEFPTLITSLCFSDDFILVGLLNGMIKVFDNSGELMRDNWDSVSRVPITLGCAISPNGRDVVAVSGIDPQKLLLLRALDAGKMETSVMPLTSDYRREVFTRFSESGKLVYFETEKGLGIFEISSRESRVIPAAGSFVGLGESQHSGLVSVLYMEGETAELKVCTNQGQILYSKSFSCDFAHLRQIDDHLLLGCNEILLRVDVVEE